MTKAVENLSGLEVAIIGMDCRFPGAEDLAEFWRNLKDGVRSVSSFTDQELLASGIEPSVFRDPQYVRANATLEDVDLFDADYFDFSPREAELMDPQHRILLECCSKALESSGYDSAAGRWSVGVYVGANTNTYIFNLYPNLEMTDSTGNVVDLLGNEKDYLATRVSYALNLNGPSLTLQTACSTSLVAVHLACRGLLSGECDLALAGGVSVRVPQKAGYMYQEGGIHSPDGHCRAFDADAQGTTFGSGVGVVVLKLLSQALEDNDYVYATIKGSAVNNDGASKVGYTAPSLVGQAAVIRTAHQMAEVEPDTIDYIEAHATGTPLGDPVEVQALREAFSTKNVVPGSCALGSVKTNFGHLVTAAGVAGLIKTVLALTHRQIPPSLDFRRPNPHIDFENSPFYVNTTLRDWPAGTGPRRAGVSSFGVGGTNAHVVLEEVPPRPTAAPPLRDHHLILLSARSTTALERVTDRLVSDLAERPSQELADVAFTLQVGRRPHPYRRTVACRTLEEGRKALAERDSSVVCDGFCDGSSPPVVFLFPGQGCQYVHMAHELYEVESLFRSEVDRCCQFLNSKLGMDLKSVIYPVTAAARANAAEQLNQTCWTQPALFIVEYALARLLMAWGVVPAAMMGHSVGEYVAATLSGVFTLEDALTLITARGRLIQELPTGAMLAVTLAEDEAVAVVDGQLALAAVNAPSSCVVSGPLEEIEDLEKRLTSQEVRCRRLRTSHAFHSPMLEPILTRFREEIRRIHLKNPQIPYVSNLTGTWTTAAQATDENHWVRHLRETVRFSQGLETVMRESDRLFLEVGPGQTLRSLAGKCSTKASRQITLNTLPAESDRRGAQQILLRALGQLWLAGVRVNWAEFTAAERRGRIPLPTYPFDRKRYWIDSPTTGSRKLPRRSTSGRTTGNAALLALPSWRRSLAPPPLDAGEMTQQGPWLVFTDPSTFGAEVTASLRQAGQPVVEVITGDEFARPAADTYVVNPHRRGDYDNLVAALTETAKMPRNIVHTWTVTDEHSIPESPQYRDECLYRGFYSLIFLVQALDEQQHRDELNLTVVSNHLYSISGETTPMPEKATLLGPCRVIPLEHTHIRCRNIDISLATRPQSTYRDAAEQVIAECAEGIAQPVVAYRNYDRWVQDFEAVDQGRFARHQTRIRQGGVYVITGGLGGLGLALADHLARTAQAKLVLISRRSFPDPAAWDRWLTKHRKGDETSQTIRRLKRMEERGASIMVLQADVSLNADMRSAIGQACEHFGGINGVFHAAGVAGGGLIRLKSENEATQVLAPKVHGTRVLETLLADTAADFLVLCSSTLALSGAVGQADYCAANAFLDAFANYAAGQSRYWTLSINWDGWRGVGMNAVAQQSRTLDHGEALDHPLIERCLRRTEKDADYVTYLDVNEHWVLAEHKIAGIPTLPGTAILEMARAAVCHFASEEPITLEDVLLLAPLEANAHGAKEVHTLLERRAEHIYFQIVSNGSTADERGARREYARGRVGSTPPKAATIPIAEIIARCPQTRALTEEELQKHPQQLVSWGERWKNLQRIHIGSDEAVAVQDLREEFSTDLQSIHLHPALLDVATSFLALVSGMHDYIPLSYGRVTVHGAIPQGVYSYARRKAGPSSEDERVWFDVTLINQGGEPVVDIEDFVLIHESALRQQENQETTGIPNMLSQNDRSAETDPLLVASGRDTGIAPAAGLEALDQILAMMPVPNAVVSQEAVDEQIERAKTLTLGRLVEELASKTGTRQRQRSTAQTAYVEPVNEIERKVVAVWQELMGLDQVGTKDNFFDMGGHSLVASQIVDRLRRTFGMEIPLSKLMEGPTVAEIAKFIASQEEEREGQEMREILQRLSEMSEEEAEGELRKHTSR